MEKRALGRGITALIPEKETAGQEKILHIPLIQIKPNPFQAREDFDSQSLEELVQSIKEKGVIQPVLVRRQGDNYELIAGERRYRAADALGLKEIPAIVKEAGDLDSLELSLIENIQRQDLNPIEEARAYQYLLEKFNLTQEKLGEVLGKSRVFVTNTLRLLKLPQEIQEEIRKGRISYGHGRVLLEVADMHQQRRLAEEIISKCLSVRELENLVQQYRQRERKVRMRQLEPYIVALQETLQQRLATRVRIVKMHKRGHIAIEFYSAQDLERIVQVIRGGKQ